MWTNQPPRYIRVNEADLCANAKRGKNPAGKRERPPRTQVPVVERLLRFPLWDLLTGRAGSCAKIFLIQPYVFGD